MITGMSSALCITMQSPRMPAYAAYRPDRRARQGHVALHGLPSEQPQSWVPGPGVTAGHVARSGGTADLHGPQRLSRKHSSGVQDTLARASLTFGQGHSKVEVRAVRAQCPSGEWLLSASSVRGFLLEMLFLVSRWSRRNSCTVAGAAVAEQSHATRYERQALLARVRNLYVTMTMDMIFGLGNPLITAYDVCNAHKTPRPVGRFQSIALTLQSRRC